MSAATSPDEPAKKKEIAIIGGGIIGCSAAYYLTRHPSYSPATHQVTLLEAASTSSGGRTADSSLQDPAELVVEGETGQPQPRNPAHDGIAGGASGKAGGLLALWAFPQNIVPLSFRLHEELAREHGGAARWGYRRCNAGQVECRARLPPPSAAGAAATSSPPKKAKKGREDGDEGDDEDDDEVEEEDEVGEDDEDEAEAGAGTRPIIASRGKGLHNKVDDNAAARKKKLAALGAPADLDWIDPSYSLLGYEGMGTPADTAQVHPELFTRSMAQMAEDAGVRIITGARVTSINTTTDDETETETVESVTYVRKDSSDGDNETDHTLPATDVIIAAGPWTSRLLPQIPVTASRAHSIVVRTPGAAALSPYALFTSIALPAGFPEPTTGGRVPLRRAAYAEPEIYARPDGTAYACGPTDASEPLPETTAGVRVDEARCADIAAQIAAVSAELGGGGGGGGKKGEVIAKQACYLPQGGPFIGPVPGLRGAVVAAGHTCWGIQNAPATGKLVSELVLEGRARSARLGGCDPARVL
ncbi:hypothetical protein SLS62_000782 [Diatrype stigma]|uniref:FAD dependent oxidoreductase domain-containing protein n=1 Tax=Diatrype stigma TaxID=117547 RepID=A0AAN9YSD6_9PEZI